MAEDTKVLEEGDIFFGARSDPEDAYGVELDARKEDYARAEAVRRLRMVRSRHPVKPLFKGRWGFPAPSAPRCRVS